ncbi:MAG TPA: hypothetical protein VF615_16265 [Longimicrobiaceae bacterium]
MLDTLKDTSLQTGMMLLQGEFDLLSDLVSSRCPNLSTDQVRKHLC